MLGRSLAYVAAVWRHVTGGVVLLLLAAVVELALPWPVKWLIDHIFGSEEVPGYLAALPGFRDGDSPGAAVLTIAGLIVVLGVAHKSLTLLSQLWLIRAGNDMVKNLRLQTLGHLYNLPLAYHDRSKVGDLMYKAVYDTYALQTMLSGVFVPIFSGVCVAIGVIVVMARIDLMLTLVTAATVPLVWITLKSFERRIETRAKTFHESESTISSQVQEALSSIRVIQAFTLEPGNNRTLAAQADTSVRENMRKSATELGLAWVIGVITALGTAVVVWFGSRAVLNGTLTPGHVLVFLAYLGTLYQPLNAFSQGASLFHSSAAQMKRVFGLLDEPLAIDDRPDAVTLPEVRGEVEFRGVTFAYDERKPALRGINLTVGAGEVVALVGRTGSGKSTMASLLLRFYDPDEGEILLDGHGLRSLKVDWLRRHVSIVFQEPMLFSATIRENIGFGRPGASEEGIVEAARRAQAHEFIAALPEGYDTPLGERGVNLSGGQRQRLSIARAFLKDAPILILDEPTSALDAGTEQDLMKALEELMKNRTVLIIAHRLSTIRRAHRIGVIEEGLLVECGSHEELMARGGRYRDLNEAQTAERKPEAP